jgi:hypothetical protein
MKQSEVLEAIRHGRAEMGWVALGEGLEVMARPARVGDLLVAVSARTAQQCAEALSTAEWVVSLTTPKVEDMIYEHAAFRPAPYLLNPNALNIASDTAVSRHSRVMLERLSGVPDGALVACGKSWVLSNGLLTHKGRAYPFRRPRCSTGPEGHEEGTTAEREREGLGTVGPRVGA